MKQETLDKARAIQRRLAYINRIREQWQRERDLTVPYQNLRDFVPEIGTESKEAAAPIIAFERACMEMLDTYEAAARVEFEAL